MPWVYDPHSGGKKIPPSVQEDLCKQAEAYARGRSWHGKVKLHLRFKNQFCYVDTSTEGDERLFPLCRLRHISRGFSLALFTYSHERYEPCCFDTGKMEGTLEEALRTCDDFIE